jgi:N-acetylglucosaminyl-diphospho-decaprenol L-rhamnosyltransferase
MIEALIVTYNSEGEIEECLAAAKAAGVDVAVLDNLSTDGTADLIADRHPWVRLIRATENRGFGAGTNELAETSSAEYLMPLNPDAILAPETPSVLKAALDSDPGAIAAGPKLIYPDGERQPSNPGFPDLTYEIAMALAGTRFSQMGRWDGIAHDERVTRWSWSGDGRVERTEVLWATCWLLRAPEVRQYGLFDLRFAMYDEDLDFCARMAAQGRSFLYVPEALVVHYGGASSTSAQKARLTRRARFNYYRHNRGIGYAFTFRVLLVAIERGLLLLRAAKGAAAFARRLRHDA